MSGASCCMVGCSASSARCKGLTFHAIPKEGKNAERNEWHHKLIHTINRCDSGFNKKNAKICSRHFTEDCFSSYSKKKKLKLHSLPTLFLPSKSIPSQISAPRKPPVHRDPPLIKHKVFYYTLTEVLADVAKLDEWVKLPSNETENLILGLIENDTVKIKLTVTSDLKCSVIIKGVSVNYCSTAIEEKGLKNVTENLMKSKICLGVPDPDLQQFAEAKTVNSETMPYYLEVSNTNVAGVVTSTVRSSKCVMLLQTEVCCNYCLQTRCLLKRKQKRSLSKNNIHPKTPLSRLSKTVIANELIKVRKREKFMSEQLQSITQKL